MQSKLGNKFSVMTQRISKLPNWLSNWRCCRFHPLQEDWLEDMICAIGACVQDNVNWCGDFVVCHFNQVHAFISNIKTGEFEGDKWESRFHIITRLLNEMLLNGYTLPTSNYEAKKIFC